MATVKAVLTMAEAIERDAKDQLEAWTILGQSDKYAAAMDRAAKLRRASQMSIAGRSEFLRNNPDLYA